jgi:hypothetical protein
MRKTNIKKALIGCLAMIFLFSSSCNEPAKHYKTTTLPNDKEFTVWNTLHVFYEDMMGEKCEFDANYDFIKSMSVPIKTIITRYAVFYPLDKESELKLAQALGDFSTLKEARNVLLKDWTGKDLVPPEDFPAVLRVKETEESLFFKHWRIYGDDITDEFKISKNGKITYLKQPEPIEEIPYSRKVLFNEYPGFRLMLNSEPASLDTLFLDIDNIKSVGVNKRDDMVYIEQKNKNPEYFVLSDLTQYLDSLAAFKVKSLDEIARISIYDTGRDYPIEFDEFIRIESSAITSINSYIALPDEYDLKCVTFVIKE